MLFASVDASAVLTIVALATGLAGAAAALLRIIPDRTGVVVGYQAQVLDDLNEERKRLLATIEQQRREIDQQREEINGLKRRVLNLERQNGH